MENEKTIDPTDLPEKGVFERKEIFQHPQPAQPGRAIDEEKASDAEMKKPSESSGNEEGLNEALSTGSAGAFEGFENQKNE